MKSKIIESLSLSLVVAATVLGSGLGSNLYYEEIDMLLFGNTEGAYRWYQILAMVTVMLVTDILFVILAGFILVVVAVYIMRMSCEELTSSFYSDKSMLLKIDENNGRGFPWWLLNLPRRFFRSVCAVVAPHSL